MNEPATGEAAERRTRRRRRIGLVMIVTAIGLVLAGQFVLDPYLTPASFIVYWGLCSIFVVLALFTALVDMVAVRREAAREKRRLVQETFARTKDSGGIREHSEQGKNGKE